MEKRHSNNQKNNALVSVIIPCYKQAQYLPDALNSVLSQTYTNWECIIVNDGSPDNTEEVVREWVVKDKRFIYLKKENGGLSSARNAGLKVAKGNYLQFLDSDDALHEEKFFLQIKALDSTCVHALSISDYFSSIATNLTQKHPSRSLSPRFKSSNHIQELITDWEKQLSIPIHCFFFKTALFFDHNIAFNEELLNHEDWDCWMNIFKLKPEVVYVDQKLATYRIRDDSMCRNKQLMNQGYLKAIKIQKASFSKISEEYGLLSKKHNQIKYGVFTRNIIVVYFRITYLALKKYLKMIFRKIMTIQS